MRLYWLIKKYNKMTDDEKKFVYDNLMNENIDKIYVNMHEFKIRNYVKNVNRLNKTERNVFINYINTKKLQLLTCFPNSNKRLTENGTICEPNSEHNKICKDGTKKELLNYTKKTGFDVAVGAITGAVIGAVVGSLFPGIGTIIGASAGATSGAANGSTGALVSDAMKHIKHAYGHKHVYKKYELTLVKNINNLYYPPTPNSLLKTEIRYRDSYEKVLNYTSIHIFINGLTGVDGEFYNIKYYKIGEEDKPYEEILYNTQNGNNVLYEFDVYDQGEYQVSIIMPNKNIHFSEKINVVTKEEFLKEDKLYESKCENFDGTQLIKNYTWVLERSKLTTQEASHYSYELFNIIADEYYINRKYLQHICNNEPLKHEKIYIEGLYYCTKNLNKEYCLGLIEVKFCNAVINNNAIMATHIVRIKAIIIMLYICPQNTKISEHLEKIYKDTLFEMISIVRSLNRLLARRLIRQYHSTH
jgi:hypothetical protein